MHKNWTQRHYCWSGIFFPHVQVASAHNFPGFQRDSGTWVTQVSVGNCAPIGITFSSVCCIRRWNECFSYSKFLALIGVWVHFGWQVVAKMRALKVRAERLEGNLLFPPWLPPSTKQGKLPSSSFSALGSSPLTALSSFGWWHWCALRERIQTMNNPLQQLTIPWNPKANNSHLYFLFKSITLTKQLTKGDSGSVSMCSAFTVCCLDLNMILQLQSRGMG